MCSPLSSLWKCFWDIIFMTCTYMGSFTLTANVYFGVKSPTACLCEFLIYVSFFKSTLKTQASKNSQMHKAIPFTKLLYSLLKSVGGGWRFLFLLEWEKQNCDTTGPELFSQLHSDFWKGKLWRQTLPSFPVSKGMKISLFKCLIRALFSLTKYLICYQNKLLIYWLSCHTKVL